MKRLIFLLVAVLTTALCNAQVVKESQVPANVKAVANTKLEGLKVGSWVLDKNRGYYVGTATSKDIFKMVTISLDGKWIETNQALQPGQVPAAIMASLKKNYLSKGYEGSNYVFVTDTKGKYYMADMSSDDEDLEITLDTNGKILKKEAQ